MWQSAAANSFDNFAPLVEAIQKYQDPNEADKICKIQKELDDTMNVMHSTIDKVLERGVKLDDLVEKSKDLSGQSKMFYKTARHYTALQGIPLRSPYRLLDASMAHKTFLFSKKQMLEIPFMMSVCLRGWGSGWRDIEIESLDQMRNTLKDLDANLDGFETFVEPGGQGERELSKCMEEAHASGFVGTPHYVFHDVSSDRQIELFGREHLALIRSKLSEQGLARNDDVQTEFSHAWTGP